MNNSKNPYFRPDNSENDPIITHPQLPIAVQCLPEGCPVPLGFCGQPRLDSMFNADFPLCVKLGDVNGLYVRMVSQFK